MRSQTDSTSHSAEQNVQDLERQFGLHMKLNTERPPQPPSHSALENSSGQRMHSPNNPTTGSTSRLPLLHPMPSSSNEHIQHLQPGYQKHQQMFPAIQAYPPGHPYEQRAQQLQQARAQQLQQDYVKQLRHARAQQLKYAQQLRRLQQLQHLQQLQLLHQQRLQMAANAEVNPFANLSSQDVIMLQQFPSIDLANALCDMQSVRNQPPVSGPGPCPCHGHGHGPTGKSIPWSRSIYAKHNGSDC